MSKTNLTALALCLTCAVSAIAAPSETTPPAAVPVHASAPSAASSPATQAPAASSDGVRPFTLGEVESKQGELARARMDAEIARAHADARGADGSSLGSLDAVQIPGAIAGKKMTSDPSRDFVPYGYYKFRNKACADVLYRGMLYTRCAGDAETLEGWQLATLTPERAQFVKGRETRTVPIGISAATDSAQNPAPSGTVSANGTLPVPPMPTPAR